MAPRRLHATLAGVAVAVPGPVLGSAAAALGAVPVRGRHPHVALRAKPVPLRRRQLQLTEWHVGKDSHWRALLPGSAARLEGSMIDVLDLKSRYLTYGLPGEI